MLQNLRHWISDMIGICRILVNFVINQSNNTCNVYLSQILSNKLRKAQTLY